MRRRLLAMLSVFVVAVAACGGSAATVGVSGDGGGADGGADGAQPGDDAAGDTDGRASDSGAGMDSPSDAPAEATACNACQPDFCGCGQCTADQVVCTKTKKPCPLGCATACDLSLYTCACSADRCVRTSPAPSTPVPCYTTLDCPPGNCCMARSGLLQGACVAGNGC